MKRLGGILLAAALATCAFPQRVTRGFGSVVFPGGTASTTPGITRNFGSAVFPGGSPSTPPVHPGATFVPPIITSRPSTGFSGNSFNRSNTFNPGGSFNHAGSGNRGRGTGRGSVIYAYPMFAPGYYDASPADAYAPATPPNPQQPDVSVVYPQQQEVRPIIIQMPPEGEYTRAARRAAPAAGPEPEAEAESPHYLIAFKDHTIYTVVAYWFDSDTLHYFTTGDTHNQAPVALLDRDLTERLNREMGIDFKLPAPK